MDGGGDLVALCDTAGTMAGAGPNGTTLNNTARVVAQWTYDAYGAAQTAEHFYSHAFAHCGHKGLFFDRLDVGVAEGNRPTGLPSPNGSTVEGGETPRLVPFAHAVYHNRNRMYSPQLGRFLQQDPNATAMSLLAAASHSGRSMGAIAVAFSIRERNGDGMNLYEYLRSNTRTQNDPTSLFIGGYALNSGARLAGLAADLITQYSANLDGDAAWALDWSRSDDGHSRLDNTWIVETFAMHLNSMVRDSLLGPLAMIQDAYHLGEDIGEYLFGEEDESGPAVAGGIPIRIPFGKIIHGSNIHRKIMGKMAQWTRGLGYPLKNIRMNQSLVDPIRNVKLSNLRPDVQAIKGKTIQIIEICISQTPEAARSKWIPEIERLKGMGYVFAKPEFITKEEAILRGFIK